MSVEEIVQRFDVSALSGATAAQQAEETVDADWTSPYLVTDTDGNELDAVARLVSDRMVRARPIPKTDVLNKHSAMQDRLLRQTGQNQGLPLTTGLVGSLFNNVTRKDGTIIYLNSTVGIIRDSYIFLPSADMQSVEMVGMQEGLTSLGFDMPDYGPDGKKLKKKAQPKSDESHPIPATFLSNSWRRTRDNKDRAIASMSFLFNSMVNGDKFAIDCRIAPLFVNADEIEKAAAGENANPMAEAYVSSQKALAYGRLIDILAAITSVEGVPFTRPVNERQTIRLFQVWMSQCYYGASAVTSLERLAESEAPYTTYHALVKKLVDPVQAGGNFQNMPSDRKTAGLNAQFYVPVK